MRIYIYIYVLNIHICIYRGGILSGQSVKFTTRIACAAREEREIH